MPVSTKKALTELKANGYKVVVATSRCKDELNHTPAFFREFPFDAMIYDGGAVIEINNQFIEETPISSTDMQTLINYVDKHHVELRYAGKDFDYFHTIVPQVIRDVYFKLYLCVPSVKPYEGENVTNVLIYVDDKQKVELEKSLEACAFTDHHSLFELTAKGVNKATAIAKVVAHFGYSMDEVIAFGDGFNDVEMLSEAGLGIAMGNGSDYLKEAADDVCADISEDVIYKACLKYELIEER